jgi:uracil-DNA glycosylase family 4
MGRKVRNLAADRRRYGERLARKIIAEHGMYPLDAPGMPPPGPDFLRVAQGLGDGSVHVKATKTKPEQLVVGGELLELYKRALREPGFTLAVQVRLNKYKNVIFVPGHLWGENYQEWVRTLADRDAPVVPVTGPYRADVMVIGKMPWKDETVEGRNFVGDTGRILIDTCRRLKIKGLRDWYVTNLCKFMPPDESSNLRGDWIKDCLPILQQEFRLVRPKYVLFLGADASKAVLGEKFTVTHMQGRVVDYSFPTHPGNDCPSQTHVARCMTVLHPAMVAKAQGPHEARQLERGMARFGLLLSGADFMAEDDVDHRTCTSYEEAEGWVDEVHREMSHYEPRNRILAIDAEWEGQHWCNDNAWLATLQVSWADKKAVCFHLRDEKGKKVFRDAKDKPAIRKLAALLTAELGRYRIAGHFFVSDLEMLLAEGFDFRPGYEVPAEDGDDGTPAWRRCMRGEGGLDTALMAHAVEETGMLGLENLAVRYTTVPPYWVALEEEVRQFCQREDVKRSSLEGYGKFDREILIPYGLYDADVTRRLAVTLMDYLDGDYEGNNCWEPFWESMITQPVILEIHQMGIHVDRRRIDDLTMKFLDARHAKEEQIKIDANWPDPPEEFAEVKSGKNKGQKKKIKPPHPAFKIRSLQHVREYLYGEALSGKRNEKGDVMRIRPPSAVSLEVTPLLDTGKPPKRWADVVAANKTDEHSPSTTKSTLAILAQENLDVADQINAVRDHRFLDQVLKSVLRPPVIDEGDWPVEDDTGLTEQGILHYDAGLAACIDDDGMVRTHVYPTAETGRWKHSRPNLANISKTRDPDYDRLLGKDEDGEPRYKHKLRSIFRAPPRGVSVPVVKMKGGRLVVEYESDADWLLLEADLKGAELYMMALMSGDHKMIDHAQRANNFPEDGYDAEGTYAGKEHKKDCKKGCPRCMYPHPEFYDIHSNVAKLAFKLDCHASKAGLKALGKGHLRNIAKTVIFGIAYGRQAKAIALAAREQRRIPKPGEEPEPEITVEDAQAVIDAVFAMYPALVPFFAEAQRRATEDRWLCNCFGRFRRFPPAMDDLLAGEFERQAMNYPIQSGIASLVDRWLSKLHLARGRLVHDFGEYLFYWQLQIHDALLIRLKARFVDYVGGTLIPWSLTQLPIYPTKLDGMPVPGRGPYYLGSDMEVMRHWGERISVAECEALGVPAKYGKG